MPMTKLARICFAVGQSFRQRPHKQNCPSGQVPKASRIQRRNRSNGVANREICGTPDKVNAEKSEKSQRRRLFRDVRILWALGNLSLSGGGTSGHVLL